MRGRLSHAWGGTPPALGARVAWGHPLARGLYECVLFQEGTGLPRNVGLGAPNAGTASPGAWAPAPRWGLGQVIGSGAATISLADSVNYAAGDFTLRWIVRPVSWSGGFADPFSKGNELRLFLSDSGGLMLTAGGTDGAMVGVGLGLDVVQDVVVTRAGSAVTYYVDGEVRGTDTVAGTTPTATALVANGDGARGTGNPTYACHGWLIWTRALLPAEVAWLTVEPWAFVAAPALTRWMRWGGAVVAGHPTMRRWGGVPHLRPTMPRWAGAW